MDWNKIRHFLTLFSNHSSKDLNAFEYSLLPSGKFSMELKEPMGLLRLLDKPGPPISKSLTCDSHCEEEKSIFNFLNEPMLISLT